MESWQTHEVDNQPAPLENYNLFTTDKGAAGGGVAAKAPAGRRMSCSGGAELGTARAFDLGRLANQNTRRCCVVSMRAAIMSDQSNSIRLARDSDRVMRRGLHSAPWAG